MDGVVDYFFERYTLTAVLHKLKLSRYHINCLSKLRILCTKYSEKYSASKYDFKKVCYYLIK